LKSELTGSESEDEDESEDEEEFDEEELDEGEETETFDLDVCPPGCSPVCTALVAIYYGRAHIWCKRFPRRPQVSK